MSLARVMVDTNVFLKLLFDEVCVLAQGLFPGIDGNGGPLLVFKQYATDSDWDPIPSWSPETDALVAPSGNATSLFFARRR